jgi:thiosulfate dehydrogenase
MKTRWTFGLALVSLLAATLLAWGGRGTTDEAPLARMPQPVAEGAVDGWASRTVWACDRRKAVVVEGVRPDQKLSPAKAQQVADLLTDLMRYCNAEVVAHISRDELITLSVDGLPFEHYVPGGPVPIELTHGKAVHTAREEAIWKAELDKLVKEGDRLFHSDELGTNGIACAMCHPHASNTHPETYPKFQTQLKKVALLRDMVNWCILNPLEGAELVENDARMKALEAYMLQARTGTPLAVGKH